MSKKLVQMHTNSQNLTQLFSQLLTRVNVISA